MSPSRVVASRTTRALLCLASLAIAPPRARADGAPAAVVTMTDDDTFEPATVVVRVGETVLWKNTSKVVHTVTADPKLAKDPKHVELPEGAAPFDSGKVAAGATYARTFTVPGRYAYVCLPHEKEGMLGAVVVKR